MMLANCYCCHPILLDKNDEFLSTLLKPLADVNDNLEDDEIEKLPLQLQYYEGHRCQDLSIIDKIIESLYQLGGSEIGRKTLRIKGIYALLREFDRASLALSKKNSLVTPPMIPVAEDGITNAHSQSVMHDRQDLQVASIVHDNREMTAKTTKTQDVKFLGETGNLIYIDGQNCSTLHALIGLLIQD
uniref:DUF384 domain-containing protein n=1 Tax=Loa loa TaxID=7209 RepID=A0A1I7VHS3_LOALO